MEEIEEYPNGPQGEALPGNDQVIPFRGDGKETESQEFSHRLNPQAHIGIPLQNRQPYL